MTIVAVSTDFRGEIQANRSLAILLQQIMTSKIVVLPVNCLKKTLRVPTGASGREQ